MAQRTLAGAGAPLRVGLRARAGSAERLTPLCYRGGFEPKTLIYETLVRRGDDGRLAPGLAESWTVEDGGRRVRLVIREGAQFHDQTPVTAAAIRQHFRRWVGLPEHDWLPCNQRIVDVTAESKRVLCVQLDRPWALLPELCAINPCAVAGPGCRDREGEHVRPVGSGPFRFVDASADGARWRVARSRDGSVDAVIEVVPFPRSGRGNGDGCEPLDALARGELDVFVGGWDEDLPAARVHDLARDPELRVVDAPGSSVVSLAFRLADGPTSERAVRARIAAAISRSELIRRAEGGYADPCEAWAAPAVTAWPRPNAAAGAAEPARAPAPASVALRIESGRSARAIRVAAAVREQLERAGFVTSLVERGGGDIAVRVSHGVPYDPHITLVTRFGSTSPAADSLPRELRELVDQAAATPGEEERIPIYAAIQELLDREVLMVPLYTPRRIAVHRADVEGLRLGIDLYHVDLSELRRRN